MNRATNSSSDKSAEEAIDKAMAEEKAALERLALGRNWPKQVFFDHTPFWRVWRAQRERDFVRSTKNKYIKVEKLWLPFSKGRNLDPKLMIEWHALVVRYYSRGNPNYSRRWVSLCVAVVPAYTRWLMLMGAITCDPGPCMPPMRCEPPKKKEIFTHAEYQKIVTVAVRDHSDINYAWLIVLAYHTGMSLVDCSLLEWSEVHLSENGISYIERVRKKMKLRTSKRCVIPIPFGGELWTWLKGMDRPAEGEWQEGDGPNYVAPLLAEQYVSDFGRFQGRFRQVLINALDERDRTRGFRHLRNTFVSRLVNSGGESALICKMTGHESLDQLAAYLVPDLAALQKVLITGMRSVDPSFGSQLVLKLVPNDTTTIETIHDSNNDSPTAS
jgi:integrase